MFASGRPRTALHPTPVGNSLTTIGDEMECGRSATSPPWGLAAARHSASRAWRSSATRRSPLSQAMSSRRCEPSCDEYHEPVLAADPPAPESLLANTHKTELLGVDSRTALQHEPSRSSSTSRPLRPQCAQRSPQWARSPGVVKRPRSCSSFRGPGRYQITHSTPATGSSTSTDGLRIGRLCMVRSLQHECDIADSVREGDAAFGLRDQLAARRGAPVARPQDQQENPPSSSPLHLRPTSLLDVFKRVRI